MYGIFTYMKGEEWLHEQYSLHGAYGDMDSFPAGYRCHPSQTYHLFGHQKMTTSSAISVDGFSIVLDGDDGNVNPRFS